MYMRNDFNPVCSMKRFSNEDIQKLRDQNDIVQVAERLGIELTRGKALCLWHPDKHPSLVFDPKRQTCHCWSCGKTADVIELVEKVRGVGFREACGWLADTHDVVIQQSNFQSSPLGGIRGGLPLTPPAMHGSLSTRG